MGSSSSVVPIHAKGQEVAGTSDEGESQIAIALGQQISDPNSLRRLPSLLALLPMVDVIRWLNISASSRDGEMFALLYAELHRIARGRMARSGQGNPSRPPAWCTGHGWDSKSPLRRSGRLRESFLSEACRGDAELRLEVQCLLAKAHNDALTNHDLEGVLATVAPNAVVIGSTPGEIWSGTEERKVAYRHFFEGFEKGTQIFRYPFRFGGISSDMGWLMDQPPLGRISKKPLRFVSFRIFRR
jgi:hypothetical protein